MKKLLIWLSEHRLFNIIIVVLLLLGSMFGHNTAELPFFWIVRQFGRSSLNIFMALVLGIPFILLCIAGYKKYLIHPDKGAMRLYGVTTVLLIFAAIAMIMPYRSEGMHFPQYAIMALMVFPLFRKFFPTLIFAAILGILDEGYQYFGLTKYYLDYNDMVLNFLGSALGTTIAMLFFYDLSKPPSHEFSFFKKVNTPVYWAYVGLFLMMGLLIFTDVMVYFSDVEGLIHLYRHDTETYNPAFWYELIWGQYWHQIRPLEGVGLMLFLPFLYFGLDCKFSKDEPNG